MPLHGIPVRHACLLRATWRPTPLTAPSSRRLCGRLLPQTPSSGAMTLCITAFLRAAMPPTQMVPRAFSSTGGCSAISTKLVGTREWLTEEAECLYASGLQCNLLE